MKPSVLVIEPDEAMRGLFATALDPLRFEVEVLASSRRAVAELHRRQFDLVITALYMADVDGIEVVSIVRTLRQGTPILVVDRARDASAAVDYLEVARMLGATASLSHPVTVDQVQAVVDRLLPPAGPD